jgi:hypothetical protein
VQLPASVLLAIGFLLPRGMLAGALALPWLVTTGLIALLGIRRLLTARSDWCISAGLIYLSIGAFWAVLDRWGARPLQFDPVIVLLTAIHFHYAGFALPVLTGLAEKRLGGLLSRLATYGVVSAVPLVAMGITTTQISGHPLLESLASCLLAAAGILTGVLYLRLAWKTVGSLGSRTLWTVAGVSLIGSLALAAAYGLRSYVPVSWLDIPTMRAWHGTANAIGFALFGLMGWTFAEQQVAESAKTR